MSKVAAKAVLRKEMKKLLKLMDNESITKQSKLISQKVLTLPPYKEASLPNEVDTSEIVEDIFNSGKRCYIPRYFSGSRNMDMVLVKDSTDLASLPFTNWGIRQPLETEQRETALSSGGVDVVIVPGLAFNSEGARLGKGGGFYDTWLAKAQVSPTKPLVVALAFREQLVSEIPTDDHDSTVDIVICSN